MVVIPKKTRHAVYSTLFNDGVLVCKKDYWLSHTVKFTLPKGGEINVPHLWVMKMMQSLRSRGYVKETFNWQYFYWVLTDEGISYLREYLHLPEDLEIVPATMRKPKATGERRPPRSFERGPRGERPPTTDEKKLSGPGGDFAPSFRGGERRGPREGGFGRGGGRGRDFGGGYRRERPEGGAPAPGGRRV